MPKKAIIEQVKKEDKKVVKGSVIVEDVNESDEGSDVESNVESNVESDVESDEGSDVGSDVESDEGSDEEESESKDKTDKKEKPKKLTHDEIIIEINKILEAESTLENEINELEKVLLSKTKLRAAYRRAKNKNIALLPKAYLEGCNKARKEKKKRTNSSKSGILAEHPIPPILLKFLGLPDNTLMMRPKVFSLLNNKFKELGLKKGQETILDKKTAKLFGFEEGHVIRFQECQKFLADIYEKANPKTTEVVL